MFPRQDGVGDAVLDMDARMSRAEPRQYFIGDGAGIARDAGERLRRTEQFDEIALGEIIFGQRADVDGQAVHRYAPDDRQPCAAMPGGPAAAQAAWPAVGIAERDRRKPLRRRRDMIEAITDPRPRLDGADLEHAGVEPDNGA